MKGQWVNRPVAPFSYYQPGLKLLAMTEQTGFITEARDAGYLNTQLLGARGEIKCFS